MNTQEAENADFVCRICKMIDEVDTTHRKKSEELKKTMTDMIESWEDTNDAGAVNTNDMVHALLDRVDKLEHCVEELVKRMSSSQTDKATLDTTMEGPPVHEEENEKKPNQIDYQQHGPVIYQSGTPSTGTYDSGAGPHLQHENGMTQVQKEQQEATTFFHYCLGWTVVRSKRKKKKTQNSGQGPQWQSLFNELHNILQNP